MTCMPTNDTLERFIARVEQNAHAEAVEEFYTVDASQQENHSPPRVGRDKHVAAERTIMSRAKSISSQCVRPVFVNGERVVIRWIFQFEWPDATFRSALRLGGGSEGSHFSAGPFDTD